MSLARKRRTDRDDSPALPQPSLQRQSSDDLKVSCASKSTLITAWVWKEAQGIADQWATRAYLGPSAATSSAIINGSRSIKEA